VVTVISLDIAKSVFQVHGIKPNDKVIIRRKPKHGHVLSFFRKQPPPSVGTTQDIDLKSFNCVACAPTLDAAITLRRLYPDHEQIIEPF
jgi:hypothetical protein